MNNIQSLSLFLAIFSFAGCDQPKVVIKPENKDNKAVTSQTSHQSVNTGNSQSGGHHLPPTTPKLVDSEYKEALNEIGDSGGIKLNSKFISTFILTKEEIASIQEGFDQSLRQMSESLRGKIQPLELPSSAMASYPNSTAFTIPADPETAAIIEAQAKTFMEGSLGTDRFNGLWPELVKASESSFIMRGFGKYRQDLIFSQSNPGNSNSFDVTHYTRDENGRPIYHSSTTLLHLGAYFQSLFNLE